MEFSKTEQVFFNKYTGNFATPKKLNRSTKKISEDILTEIEGGNISSQTIKKVSLSFPVFVYKTCLTIHGNLPEINRSYIGGYKNLIQNKNGSLEIRYSAIDYKQKKEIANYLRNSEFSSNQNSHTGIYFFKSKRTTEREAAINIYNELKKEADNFNVTGMKAKISVSGYCYFGMYYITLYIYPLLIEGDTMLIASQIANIPVETIEAKKKEEENKYIKEQQEREQRINLIEAAKLEAKNNLQSKYRTQQIKPKLGSIYAIPTCLNNGLLGYRFFKVDKLGNFGRLILQSYCSQKIELDASKFEPYRKGKQIGKADLPTNTFFIQ